MNKRTAIVIALGALGVAALAAVSIHTSATPALAVGSASLTVTLGSVAGTKGKVMAALCNKSTFLKHCDRTAIAAAGPGAMLHFDAIAPGAYAVMVFHDENDNDEFDKAANGMPLEGYGFSRDARGKYGPPAFDDAVIDLKPGTATINIDMSY